MIISGRARCIRGYERLSRLGGNRGRFMCLGRLICLCPVGGRAEQGPAGHTVFPIVIGHSKCALAELTFDYVRRKLSDDIA